MEKVDLEGIQIEPHHIVVAHTSEPNYEMKRQILLEIEYDVYIVVEGWHCSCYDFDDSEWEAIQYTGDELEILANASYNVADPFWEQVKLHV